MSEKSPRWSQLRLQRWSGSDRSPSIFLSVSPMCLKVRWDHALDPVYEEGGNGGRVRKGEQISGKHPDNFDVRPQRTVGAPTKALFSDFTPENVFGHENSQFETLISQLLHSSPHAEARAMSAVLLRRILTIASDDESQSQTLYPSLSPNTQSTLKSTLLDSLAQYIGETLVPHLSHRTDPDVRIAALGASINFIQALEEASDLLPLMMQTLTEALNSGEESTAQEAIELLIKLAGTEPRFLRKQIAEVVGAMLQIAEAETLEEGTKHLAVEFVITLAEARERAPGMIRKLPQFMKRLFEILMKMLLDVPMTEDGSHMRC
ncbi:hypothetical protein LXL04_032555 [Taraxacum kok-saghyz]